MLNKKIAMDEKVATLSDKAALLYTWIIPFLDREGKFYATSVIIKGQVMPFRHNFSLTCIAQLVSEIEKAGLITVYGKSREYLIYKGFLANNIPHPHEAKSEIPNPDNVSTMSLQCNGQLNGIELNRIEKKGSKNTISVSKLPDGSFGRLKAEYKTKFREVFKITIEPDKNDNDQPPFISQSDVFALHRIIKRYGEKEVSECFYGYFRNKKQDTFREKLGYSLVGMEKAMNLMKFNEARAK